MILTAYFDESGTHDDSPITVMAGVMANASQWQRFEMKFRALKQKYGFQTFHTKKFKASSGDFRGWSPFKKFVMAQELAAITSDAFMESVTFTLDNTDYRQNYLKGEKPDVAA